MKRNVLLRCATVLGGFLWILVAVFLFIPFAGAADTTPTTSSSTATPPPSTLSAALFSGTTAAPPDDAWKTAPELKGIRMGRGAHRHSCVVKQIAEWVSIACSDLPTARVDLIAGEKRDLKFFNTGERASFFGSSAGAQFSMHPGDRRVIQWTSPDLWWSVWQGDEGKMASGIMPIGSLFGLMVQVDWASGPEPVIAIY